MQAEGSVLEGYRWLRNEAGGFLCLRSCFVGFDNRRKSFRFSSWSERAPGLTATHEGIGVLCLGAGGTVGRGLNRHRLSFKIGFGYTYIYIYTRIYVKVYNYMCICIHKNM